MLIVARDSKALALSVKHDLSKSSVLLLSCCALSVRGALSVLCAILLQSQELSVYIFNCNDVICGREVSFGKNDVRYICFHRVARDVVLVSAFPK